MIMAKTTEEKENKYFIFIAFLFSRYTVNNAIKVKEGSKGGYILKELLKSPSRRKKKDL